MISFATQTEIVKTSGLTWIQTVWQSDCFAEWFFLSKSVRPRSREIMWLQDRVICYESRRCKTCQNSWGRLDLAVLFTPSTPNRLNRNQVRWNTCACVRRSTPSSKVVRTEQSRDMFQNKMAEHCLHCSEIFFQYFPIGSDNYLYWKNMVISEKDWKHMYVDNILFSSSWQSDCVIFSQFKQ